MSLICLMLVMLPLLPVCRVIRSLCRRGQPERALHCYRVAAATLGTGVLLSMAAQEALLFFAGQLTWATALPLHLCSLMGVITLPALMTRRETLLYALLCAGAPGAALALLFPAIADTPWPHLTGFFFSLMHAGILLAPLLPLSLGWRPCPRGTLPAGLFLSGAGIAALIANRLTGGNYLFLTGPVAGTPLTLLSHWGKWRYRLLLALLAAALLAGEAALICLLTSVRRTAFPSIHSAMNAHKIRKSPKNEARNAKSR